MNLKSHIFIFSVYSDKYVDELNKENHARVMRYMNEWNIPAMELSGKYQGKPEVSILIEGSKYEDMVKNYTNIYDQECYLESHSDRATFLVFGNGQKKYIGTLKPVSKEVAERSLAYSYNPVTQQYYITEQ